VSFGIATVITAGSPAGASSAIDQPSREIWSDGQKSPSLNIMEDLFSDDASAAPAEGSAKRREAARRGESYSAADIEVLEGLEPVRRRPGMYVGGTDETALHHLVAEVLDNAMDEAVAGHADRIELHLGADGAVTVSDNGRGIPIDAHPKYPEKSALEVILTTLHSGGKFKEGAYRTAGGLHGVGISVVNALAAELEVEVVRERRLWRQRFARGTPVSRPEDVGAINNRRGTRLRFLPDPEIFKHGHRFRPERLHRMARSKAYLFRGVEIRWSADAEALGADAKVPARETSPGPRTRTPIPASTATPCRRPRAAATSRG
jgi:topoisomerase-4 subunit B